MKVKRRTIVPAVLVAALAPIVNPVDALAGAYQVTSCEATSANSTRGWDAQNVAGMDADRLCPAGGDLLRGLATFNRSNVGRLSQGASSSVTFRAPAGTSLAAIDYRWDGYRANSDWTIGLTSGETLLSGCAAGIGEECHLGRNGTEQRRTDLGGRSLVSVEARCDARDGCWTSATGDDEQRNRRARVQLLAVTLTIDDPSAPGVADLDGDLWESGWIRGGRSASFSANDNTGIRSTRVTVDGVQLDSESRPCNYTQPVPCGGVSERRTALDTATLTDGTHAVVIEAEDAAGNTGQVSRAIAVDNHGPDGFFEPRATEDRERIVASVSDAASGPASGSMEMRRLGATGWTPVPAALEGTQVVGRLPSSGLEPGVYEFRALVDDRAGNASVLDTMEDGTPARFTVPGSTRLEAGILAPGGGVVEARRVNNGEAAQAEGRLQDANGDPVGGQAIVVEARLLTVGAEWRPEGRTTTDGDGRFAYRVPPGPGRHLRFRFEGTDAYLASEDAVRVDVPAATTLRVSKRRVPGGGRVRFTGDVLGGPMPPRGKLVNLQAYYRGKWRTFALPRAAGDGGWQHRYRFGATTAKIAYRFRALVPREDGYPYGPGRSKTIRVVVDGR